MNQIPSPRPAKRRPAPVPSPREAERVRERGLWPRERGDVYPSFRFLRMRAFGSFVSGTNGRPVTSSHTWM